MIYETIMGNIPYYNGSNYHKEVYVNDIFIIIARVNA